jgi:predicted TPR repeat methyltransferase
MNQDQWVHKALNLLNQGKLGPARAICNKILSQSADHHQANALMGAINISLQEPKEALPYLHRAHATARNAQERAQALNNLGLANTHLADYPAALKALDSALEEVCDNALFYCNRANVYELIGNWPSMATDCEAVLRLVPSLTDARVGLAVALRHQGQHQTAFTTLMAKPSEDSTDWLNEWALNGLLSDQTSTIMDMIHAMEYDASILDIADYIAEEGFAKQAKPLYECVLTRTPDHPRAKHLSDALSGTQSLRVPAEYVKTLYNHHAGEFETRLQQTLDYDLPERFATLWKNTLQKPITRWLDAGCGTGLVGAALKPSYPKAHLIGIDLSQAMIKIAQQKACYQELLVCDVMDYSSDTPFDLITAMDVAIYLGELPPVLTHWKRLLESAGVIAFSIEANDQLNNALELQSNGRFAHQPTAVEQDLNKLGFTLLHTERFILRKESGTKVPGQLFIAQLTD